MVGKGKDASLNFRQKRVVKVALKKLKPAQHDKDIVVDVAKSEDRAPVCIGATPCIVPNSLPYRIKTQRILTPEQVHACQGIYPEDFPAPRKYAQTKPSLTRDLAGNAFSTTVCMAVVVSTFVHTPSKSNINSKETSSSPSRVNKRRVLSMTPPRPTKRHKVTSPAKTD